PHAGLARVQGRAGAAGALHQFRPARDRRSAMKLTDVLNIEELHQVAKRRTPRAVFDYFEGACEDEEGMARNESVFRNYQLLPRYLVDVSTIDQKATLFGRTYSAPFGIAPTAAQGYLRPGADLMMARAAVTMDVPYVMSGLSTDSIE